MACKFCTLKKHLSAKWLQNKTGDFNIYIQEHIFAKHCYSRDHYTVAAVLKP